MKTAVIALGNPILGDDGIGWQVGKVVEQYLSNIRSQIGFASNNPNHQIDVIYLCSGGLSLMEHMVGYDRVIVVDAFSTNQHRPGTIHYFTDDEIQIKFASHINSAHDTDLFTALRMGQDLGADLPTKIEIVGIETMRVFDFDDQISPEIMAVIPDVSGFILKLLEIQVQTEVKL